MTIAAQLMERTQSTTRDRETAAHKAWTAVVNGRLQDLKEIVERHGEAAFAVVEGPGGNPISTITAAAWNGDSAAVGLLLKAGAPTDHKASGDPVQSPLAWSIVSQSVTTVRMLLDAGACPLGAEDPCDLAVLYGDPVRDPRNEILDLVLAHIKTTTETDEALHRAAERGAAEWAERLTAHGADPNHVSTRTYSRALKAVLKHHHVPATGDHARKHGWREHDANAPAVKLLRTMIEAGADLSKPLDVNRTYPDTPLLAAVEYGAAWAVPILIRAGADPEPARKEIREHGLRRGSPHAVLALFA